MARRVRAYFAPVNRAAQTPVLFDPAQQGGFSLDAPPAPWIGLGWIQEFVRTPGSRTAPVLTGYVAQRAGLGFAISLAAVALFLAAGLLLLAMSTTLRRDVERMKAELARPAPTV